MSREPRPLFDEILDLALYAPVGLVSKALDQVPGLVQAGRARIGGQVDQARVIGRFAVGLARSKAVRSFVGAPSKPARRPPERERPAPRAERATEPEATRRTPPTPEPEPTRRTPAPPAAGSGTGDRPAPPQAIPDYDALSASQVVPRLQGLDRDELAAVGRYEAATRRRRTILNRVAQLERALDER